MLERRKHKRSAIRIPVELSTVSGDRIVLVTRDISIGGMFLEAEEGELPPEGSVTNVTFEPTDSSCAYTLKARVQRHAPNGIALTFADFGLDDLRFIESMLSAANRQTGFRTGT